MSVRVKHLGYAVVTDDGTTRNFRKYEVIRASRWHGPATRWESIPAWKLAEWQEDAERTHSGPVLLEPLEGQACGLNSSIAAVRPLHRGGG